MRRIVKDRFDENNRRIASVCIAMNHAFFCVAGSEREILNDVNDRFLIMPRILESFRLRDCRECG